jgi:hypothetical protein
MNFFEVTIPAECGYILYNNINRGNNINMLVFKIICIYKRNIQKKQHVGIGKENITTEY